MTYREAIRKALDDQMTLDENVILMGEDIGLYGGCFKVTEGLFQKHPDQVIDTPVSEEGFAGLAVGSAMMGLRPVIEIMYADFFTLISDAVINHAAKTHLLSAGQFSCPLVVRLPEGSGTGHGAQHTQSPEGAFLSTSGIKIVSPSNPNDAYHLLCEAVRDDNPVLFFESKLLYPMEGEISDEVTPIGKAKVLREGKDITIISFSHAVTTALRTAQMLSEHSVDATVIDLVTLKPLDESTILSEVRKTGRVFMIQDTNAFGSVSSEVSAMISSDEDTFRSLKAPVRIISGVDAPVPFSKHLEAQMIPDEKDACQIILRSLNKA